MTRLQAGVLVLLFLSGMLPAAAAVTRDSDDRGAFLDSQVPYLIARTGADGAVVAVVADGTIIVLRGYGYACPDHAVPLDPEQTLLPIGSLSKPVTWMAVLTLADEGLVDLHTDVNSYLPVPIVPPTFREPITLATLMTHTSGLDEQVTGILTMDPARLQAPFASMQERLPARVRPPGETAAYSNAGAALAAAVIESVTGTPFDTVVEGRVFSPLGMQTATTRQPLPADTAGEAPGPCLTGGVPVYATWSASGGMHATGKDLALFLLHHLEPGERSAAAEMMHARRFGHDPRLPGITYGFFERYRNGERILWHGGDLPGSSSLIAFVPDRGTGIGAVFTGPGGTEARTELLDAFINYAYPSAGDTIIQPIPDYRERSGRYAGVYLSTRNPVAGYEKALLIGGGDQSAIPVISLPSGRIRIGNAEYIEVEPGLFAGLNTPGMLAFEEDTTGTVIRLFIGDAPQVAWERAPWYRTPDLNYGILVLFSGAFLAVAGLGTVRSFACSREGRRHYRRAVLIAVPAFLFPFLFFGSIRYSGLLYGPPPLFPLILLLPALTALIAVGTGVILILDRRRNREGWRFAAGVVLLAALYLGWLQGWGLLLPI